MWICSSIYHRYRINDCSFFYFGKAHLYVMTIMQVRNSLSQHSAGQVLVNGMPSGALIWTLRYATACCPSYVTYNLSVDKI
jgi:hypothetical protein